MEIDATLREKLKELGLFDLEPRLRQDGYDRVALSCLEDADAEAICREWGLPSGTMAKFRRLCRDLRASTGSPSAPTGVGGGPAPSPVVRPSPEATLPPLDPPLEAELLDNLPTPIARAAAGLSDAREPVVASHAIESLASTVLRFLCLVCKADYFDSRSWQDSGLNEHFKSLSRPSLGQWRQMTEQLVASAARAIPPHPLFLSKLAESWRRLETKASHRWGRDLVDEDGRTTTTVDRLGTISWLIALRNGMAHERIDRLDPAAIGTGRVLGADLIRELSWLAEYELWIGDGTDTLLLRGRTASNEGAPPKAVQRARGAVLRRRAHEGTGTAELTLPPLIVGASSVGRDGGEGGVSQAAAAMIMEAELPARLRYSWIRADGRIHSTDTELNLSELLECYARKQFPVLTADRLTSAELRLRLGDSTARTLRMLESAGKYRPGLHVARERYEGRLSRWIDDSAPLLAIEGKAGSGKTGVVANLVEQWEPDLAWRRGSTRKTAVAPAQSSERSAVPHRVLFVTARDLDPGTDTLDAILCERLQLAAGVCAATVLKSVPDLVVVLDGLNEHRNRTTILESIMDSGRRRHRGGAGLRTLMSWRSDESDWTANALAERDLFFTPRRTTASNVWVHMPRDWGTGTQAATRNLQIQASRSGVTATSSGFAASARKSLAEFPDGTRLHFIDFETATACLPYEPGMRSYEFVAFQFSSHSLALRRGKLDLATAQHHGRLDSIDVDSLAVGDPRQVDRDFVDALRSAVGDDGPVFHWSAHERTVLRAIADRLHAACDLQRLDWIVSLTGVDGGGRLIDMLRVAEGGIMSPHQQGHYSIKQLLPAACREGAVWRVLCDLMDWPDALELPPDRRDAYALLKTGPDGIRSGTDAIRAFQQLRFGSTTARGEVDATALRTSLEEYCRLDTAAMVAIWEWMTSHASRAASRVEDTDA